jgi:AraC-like DNA-binding protein
MIYEKNNRNNRLIDRAVEFILTRGTKELGTLTEEKIAETLDVKSSHLVRTFKIQQCIPLDRFITREKIHRAVFILEKDHSISIEALSKKLGFPRLKDFIMEFEHYLLIDPHRYKELRTV